MELASVSTLKGLPATSTSSHSRAARSASHAIRSRTRGPRPRASRCPQNSAQSLASDADLASSRVRVEWTSHDSSGLKAAISRSRSTINRAAGVCTRPALSPPATFLHNTGEIRYPTIRSRIRRACCALTRSILIGCGCLKASCTSALVTASNVTRFALIGSIPKSTARCQAIASPSRSRSVANQTSVESAASFLSSETVPNFPSWTA